MRKYQRHTSTILKALTLALSLSACQTKTTTETASTSPATASVPAQMDTVPPKMIWVEGGTFTMGSSEADFWDAHPVHPVTLDGFWMDEHEVTNAEFAAFVAATGYRTVAEIA